MRIGDGLQRMKRAETGSCLAEHGQGFSIEQAGEVEDDVMGRDGVLFGQGRPRPRQWRRPEWRRGSRERRVFPRARRPEKERGAPPPVAAHARGE